MSKRCVLADSLALVVFILNERAYDGNDLEKFLAIANLEHFHDRRVDAGAEVDRERICFVLGEDVRRPF